MRVSTRLGSFGSFTVLWRVMMAAMLLLGAAPAAVLRARASGWLLAAPLFAGSTSVSGRWSASWCTRCTGRTGLSSLARPRS